MLLTEFNALETNKKSDLVWEWGHYLTSRKDDIHTIALFVIHDFFAEVYISLSDNKTKEVRGVSNEMLRPDFAKMLNPDDPFVKVILKGKSSSQSKAF